MADFYMSVNRPSGTMTDAAITHGTSSTSGDEFEFRIHTSSGITRRHAILALENFKRYILEGGESHAGTDLPVN